MNNVELLKTITTIEWSLIQEGMFGGFGRGPDVHCCPYCKGANPRDKNANSYPDKGHRVNCKLEQAITELTIEVINNMKGLE